MTSINFDEPSVGDVTISGKPALHVMNKGNDNGAAGILGESINSVGVAGKSENLVGVSGSSNKLDGVQGASTKGAGVAGRSAEGVGIWGFSQHGVAGHFQGDVQVTGDIKLVNADCAEDFNLSDSDNAEAGTVMVLTEDGSLQPSYQEYDRKVAGIISGASGYRPAIVLDRQLQSQDEDQNGKKKNRLPVALMGKTYCKVDATHSSIQMGDLLTTSSTKGYAMKAVDPTQAFGAVIGKALGSIKEGLGMIPVLVALQ